MWGTNEEGENTLLVAIGIIRFLSEGGRVVGELRRCYSLSLTHSHTHARFQSGLQCGNKLRS